MKYLIALLALSASLLAVEYISWSKPVVKTKKHASHGHSGHGGKKSKRFQLNNFDHNSNIKLLYILPSLEKKELLLEDGLVSIPRTDVDNYHALVVNQTKERCIKSSVRYIYSHGRPSKISPTNITNLNKSDLEIKPSPLPREHDRYYGSKEYSFKLHFMGNALADADIILTTSNKSQLNVKSDKDGHFSITMPNDFKDVKVGKRKNRAAEFILKASHIHRGTAYATTLAMPYHVNPTDYWQSTTGGISLLIFGLILGLYLFRNINKKKGKA